jgi:hypothetical protein
MKITRTTILTFLLLIVVASLYRVWEGRPFGFAPQIAMAIFGGAVIKDRKLALLLPLLSMLISDVLYEVLFINGLTTIRGFYLYQWVNYIIFAGLVFFGFLIKKINLKNVLGFTISGSIIFFLVSNFSVWITGQGLSRPRTFNGLILCYGDALAFFRDYGLIPGFAGNFILGDIFFSFILFGSFYFIRKTSVERERTLA